MKQEKAKVTEFESPLIPQAPESERVIISALMLDNAACVQIEAMLQPSEFFIDSHRRIYRAILEMHKQGKAIDPASLADFMRADDEIYLVGGIAYIADCLTGQYRPSNLQQYVVAIKEASIRRRAGYASGKASADALDSGAPIEEALAEMHRSIEILNEKAIEDPLVVTTDLAHDRLSYIQELAASERSVGIESGFSGLDRFTAGFQPANLIILAARPSVGKTSLALCMAENAIKRGNSVAFFSLEMSKEELTDRLLCSISRVDMGEYRRSKLDAGQWKALNNAHQRLANYPGSLSIDDAGKQTAITLRAKALKFKAERGLDMIIVDYLQLMDADDRAENRQQQVAQVARSLKAIAKEFNVPLVALCQLSRDIEKRGGGRPQLSDLRDSGEIEQTADLVMFLDRPNMDCEGQEDNIANITIGKQRNGPTGKAQIRFIAQCTRFENIDWREQ